MKRDKDCVIQHLLQAGEVLAHALAVLARACQHRCGRVCGCRCNHGLHQVVPARLVRAARGLPRTTLRHSEGQPCPELLPCGGNHGMHADAQLPAAASRLHASVCVQIQNPQCYIGV